MRIVARRYGWFGSAWRCLLIAVAAGSVAPAAAFGHAAFVGSDPEPGARLEASPAEIALSFTEPLNAPLSRATLGGLTGDERDVALERRGRKIVLRVRSPLPRGAYTVRWHTVSTEDGHALEGEFSFGVRAAAAGAEHSVVQSPLARAGWLRIALRLVMYVAVLLLAAAILLPALLRRVRPSWLAAEPLTAGWPAETRRAVDRERHLTGDLAWLALGAAAGVTVAEAADAAGGVSAAGLRDFLLSGGSGPARLALLVSLAVVAFVASRRRAVAATEVSVALLGLAASGHAASASPRLASIANDWLHLASGAIWLGGLGVLVLVWAPLWRSGPRELRTAVAREVLPAFGRIALPAFALAVMTGLVSLLAQLGHLDALWTTAYGRVLLVKIGAVGCVAAISFTHAIRLRPRVLDGASDRAERRHWRLLRVEPAVGLGVVAAVAVLVTFPLPPRQLSDADDALAAAAACNPCPLPAPAADELAVAERAGSHLVAGWLRRGEGRLSGTVRILDRKGRPARAPARVESARSTSCGTGCLRFMAPASLEELRVAVAEGARQYTAVLPARWEPSGGPGAKRLLRRAERAMRALVGVREVEEVTSGPGSYARTEYRLRAPDRMAFRTNRGAETVIVGERQWFRAAGQPWTRRSYGSGIPFSTRRWFRWTPYARAARLLDRRLVGGRPAAELALADEATPVWFRLVVDVRSGRVLSERMTARAHFMRSRYLDIDRPLVVQPPSDG